MVVGIAVVSVELWQDWSQVLHQQEHEAQSHHLRFFRRHLQWTDAVLITLLCSASDENPPTTDTQKRQLVSQINCKQQRPSPCLRLLWALTSIGALQPSLTKLQIFSNSHTFTSVPLVDDKLLSYCLTTAPHPPLLFFHAPAYLLQTYSPDLGNSSTLGCSVLGRLEVPTLCISTMRTQMRKIERIVIWTLAAV